MDSEGLIRVGTLIYAGNRTSRCFADHFLTLAEQETAISASRRLHPVKLDSEVLFTFPLVIMTGEGEFALTPDERRQLRQYVERGGFVVASAGCSSAAWDRSFRREMAEVFPKHPLQALGLNHPVFHTVRQITELRTRHGRPQGLEGISLRGRLGILYSPDGLNDTVHAQGCCCCGGNELLDAAWINVNILLYAVVY